MKFKFQYMSLTDLGRLFGLKNQGIGKCLVKIGVRTENRNPTYQSQENGLVKRANDGFQGIHWHWHADRTVTLLLKAGYKLVQELPDDLVEPPELQGPFRLDETNPKFILNFDGLVVARFNSKEQAAILLPIFNLADKASRLRQKPTAPALV